MEFVVKAGGCKQTLGDVCQFLGHRGSIGPICWRMCQRWALGPLFFFCFRKISSWPCVWNYTPGSKQGSHTEKKTAVRQWITVLWPDKCLCEEWMRKLGVCQESHTHTPSLVLFLCSRLNADACELYMWTKSQVEALLLSGRNTCWCRKPTQHKPTKVEDKHPVFTNTLQS